MTFQKDESPHPEIPDDHPTNDDLMRGLLVAADRAFAQGNRPVALILIDEIFKVIDGLK